MVSKKSSLVFESFILSSRNCIASISPHLHQDASQHPHLAEQIGLVDEQLFLPGAGLADIERWGRCACRRPCGRARFRELPVPLNSSKITSSIRLPVSISAVAMIESEPPSSILRAAPKNRLGRCKGVGVDTTGQHLARAGHDGVVGAAKTRDRVQAG